MRAGKWTRIQSADMGAATHLPPDEPCALQCLDVFGGCGQRNVERLGKLPDRSLAIGKFAKHPSPRVVAEGVEDRIKLGRRPEWI